MKVMGKGQTQTEMGKISNLITDMTLLGANEKELARAVKHSMVVIDANKHKLDYKKSEQDNGIAALKKKYQGSYDENGKYHEGAATIISRAKSKAEVDKREGSPTIDPDTGELKWKTASPKKLYYTQEKVNKRTGEVTEITKKRTQSSTKMAEAKDAYELVSGPAGSKGNPKERAYADYANKMKSLANSARKEMLSAGKIEYSATAKAKYQKEVDSLTAQLNVALKNAPRERKAQLMANTEVKAKKQANPDMTKAEIKKISQQALTKARASTGAKRTTIKISDSEWEAIQAGALSETTLSKILNNTNIDDVRQRATPKTTTSLSSAKISKIQRMKSSGYTTAEIAESLGVSSSTVSKYLTGKE